MKEDLIGELKVLYNVIKWFLAMTGLSFWVVVIWTSIN